MSRAELLTNDSAIAYVKENFADSFDSIVCCDFMEDCGLLVAIVAVNCGDTIQRAYVWQDAQTNKIYGEL